MAADLGTARWAARLTDHELRAAVGPVTVERGRLYADTGAVQTLVVGDRGRMLLATVRGGAGRRYQTIVQTLGSPDGEPPGAWSGRCSCPVGHDCKHVVAVIVTVRSRLRPATAEGSPGGAPGTADWERVLAPVVQQLRGPSRPLPGLGVSLSLTTAYRPGRMGGFRTVALEPVREGRSRPWVRQGASWSELAQPADPPRVREDHRSVVAQLYAVRRPTSGYGHYAHGEVTLEDLGPSAWTQLRACLAAGVALLPGEGLSGVDLAARPAQVVTDLTREGDGGLRLRARLEVTGVEAATDESAGTAHDGARGGVDLTDAEVLLLGSPAHGVAVIDPQRRLGLWPLSGAPPEALAGLLTDPVGLEVPPADVPRFLSGYYPALARRVPVGSSDASVELPADLRPSLRLRARFGPGHGLRLDWDLTYPSPGAGAPRAVDLDLTQDDAGRDRDAEVELVHTVLEQVPGLTGPRYAEHRGRDRPWLRTPVLLDGLDTARFVSTQLPALRGVEGVRVEVEGEVPSYGEAEGAPVVHLSAGDGAVGADGEVDNDWFDLHVSVTVDGQEVPFEQLFAALARGEQVLLLESGTWFSLDRPELAALRRIIEEARELADPDTDGLRLSRYQVDLWDELEELGVVESQRTRWTQALAGLRSVGEVEPPEPPASLRATLRPYQRTGYHWLSALWDAGLGGVLADDMGLGKTLQTLAVAARALERGELENAPLLVVAPASVVATWEQEAERFVPDLRVALVTATRRRRGGELSTAVRGAHLVVTSYTLLRLEADDYRALPWSGVVLDEAQFVKNHRSATYRAARRLGAPFTVAITGTPLENSLMDLWAILSLAAPGLFPRPELFAERYRKPIESGAAPEQLAVLRRRVRPFLLRRTKEEVAPELPAKQEQVLRIELTPAHRRIYARHLARERQRVLGMLEDLQRNRVAVFRALTRLRQLSLDPSLVSDEHAGSGPSAKIEALVEQLEEVVAEGHRALVFSSFTGFLALVRERLAAEGIAHSYLDGSSRDRPALIRRFREGDDPVFLISLKAGGFGLTLTEADYVFVLDPWWNPAAEAQAVDRAHRIGQDRPVVVYRMVSQDTVEEKVVALQQRKRELFARVVDDGDYAGAGLSADDIRDLLDT